MLIRSTKLDALAIRDTFTKLATVTTLTTASALTYTAAQVAGGLILRDPNGAGRSDLFPTAATLYVAFGKPEAGQSFKFTVRNTADVAETITMTTNTGLTLSGTMTIAQNNSKEFLGVFASPTAVTFYSLGTVVH
mgnify:CR=1 FL=1